MRRSNPDAKIRETINPGKPRIVTIQANCSIGFVVGIIFLLAFVVGSIFLLAYGLSELSGVRFSSEGGNAGRRNPAGGLLGFSLR
jgi:hypothetical protein